jgi:hypothetical protein
MRSTLMEYEGEAMPEFETEYEEEYEGEFEYEGEYEEEFELEWEGEYESEEFFRRLGALARRAAQSPALRRVGLAAARSALRGLGPVGGIVGGALPQSEYEYEEEGEYEVNPIRRVYPNALMEHLGHAGAVARTEAEAEAFIGALVPLAARLLPRAAPAIMRAAPGLIRGLAATTRTLRSSPTTRPLVRTLPTVVRRTATQIARRQAQGRPVTPQAAVRTLARQTARVVGSPQQAAQAYQRGHRLDQAYHRGR